MIDEGGVFGGRKNATKFTVIARLVLVSDGILIEPFRDRSLLWGGVGATKQTGVAKWSFTPTKRVVGKSFSHPERGKGFRVQGRIQDFGTGGGGGGGGQLNC